MGAVPLRGTTAAGRGTTVLVPGAPGRGDGTMTSVTNQEDWGRRLAGLEGSHVERLGSGVEGVVYRLRAGIVAKVWSSKSVAELELMRRVYADVDAAGPPVRTPIIHEVLVLHGRAVTIERELPGVALQDLLDSSAERLPADAVSAVVQCLLALRKVAATEALRALPVLGETAPFRSAGDQFPAALVSLLDRRVAASEQALTAALPDFDQRFQALRASLAGLESPADAVVHGDLFGANIHVDTERQPVAILDFGFMTAAGDPRFDAAVTAGIMDMYGPNAEQITRQLTDEFARQLEYDPAILVLYRAAYAVATSTLFGDDLSEGHFRWCISQLSGRCATEILGL
jgi:hypothetical protein